MRSFPELATLTAVLFSSLFSAPSWAASAPVSETPAAELGRRLALPSSIPGCMTDFSGVANATCAGQGEAARAAKLVFLEDPSEFVRIVSGSLASIQGATSYRYLPILMATLSRDKRLLPALKRVAEIERSGKLAYDYAQHAIERFATGKCKPSVLPQFIEICEANDSDFNRIRRRNEIASAP